MVAKDDVAVQSAPNHSRRGSRSSRKRDYINHFYKSAFTGTLSNSLTLSLLFKDSEFTNLKTYYALNHLGYKK